MISRFDKSLILQISSLVGYFRKINAFLVYSICLHKTFHNKWCLDKTVGQIENGLEGGFVKHWLNYVETTSLIRWKKCLVFPNRIHRLPNTNKLQSRRSLLEYSNLISASFRKKFYPKHSFRRRISHPIRGYITSGLH